MQLQALHGRAVGPLGRIPSAVAARLSRCTIPSEYLVHIFVLSLAALAIITARPIGGRFGGAEVVAAIFPTYSSQPEGLLVAPTLLHTEKSLPRWVAPAERALVDSQSEPPAPPDTGEESPEPQGTGGQGASSAIPIRYTVTPGDTVSGVAAMFGVSVDTIVSANDLLDPHALQIGDELVIPPVSGVVHTVTGGDSIYDLAMLYDVSEESIVQSNGLSDPDRLQVGQQLVIPDGKIQMARIGPSSRGGRPVSSTAASSTSSTPAATGSLRWPAGGSISTYFGSGHRGIDIASQHGNPVYAADGGVVVTALKVNYEYGWHLIIDHGNGYQTLYAHLSAFYVDYGERVAKGEKIGSVGSTGLSTGPHLHFEVFQNGVKVNPLKLLP